MNASEFKQELWDSLQTMVHDKRSNVEISVRCPFCGDTRRHPDHTHFYIKLDINNDEAPIYYNCFLCGNSGVMNGDVLRMLDIHDVTMSSRLAQYNKDNKKSIKKLGFTDNDFKFKIPLPEDTKNNREKLRYVEGRMGIKLSFEQIQDMKIIFELGRFLQLNEIERITCSREKAIELNDNYVGFLTVRNEKINFRKVHDSPYGRYENYTIYKNLDNTRKFYSIPVSIDLLTTDEIIINISEGPFDILGVFFHVYKERRHNIVYSAATGTGFKSVLKYFINKGIFGDNVTVNIFSDNEDNKTKQFYRDQLGSMKRWVGEVNIYRNEISKDFGVPKNKIQIAKTKL